MKDKQVDEEKGQQVVKNTASMATTKPRQQVDEPKKEDGSKKAPTGATKEEELTKKKKEQSKNQEDGGCVVEKRKGSQTVSKKGAVPVDSTTTTRGLEQSWDDYMASDDVEEDRPGAVAIYPDGRSDDENGGDNIQEGGQEDAQSQPFSTETTAGSSSIQAPPESAAGGSGPRQPSRYSSAAMSVEATVFDESNELERIERRVKERLQEKIESAQHVEVVRTKSGRQQQQQPCVVFTCGLGFVIIISIILGVVVANTRRGKNDGQQSGIVKPMKPLSDTEYLLSILIPAFNWEYDDAKNDNSPIASSLPLSLTTHQEQALQWMIEEDQYFHELMLSKSSSDNLDDFDSGSRHVIVERYVLALLYFATNGDNWLSDIDYLNSNTSVCDWPLTTDDTSIHGIQCDEDTGTVKSIKLDQMNLNGTLPSELSLLTSLESLNFNYNVAIEGTIPLSYVALSQLRAFNCEFCNLNGTLPESVFGKLLKLESLHLTRNQITGTIPSILTSNLSKIEHMTLSGNFLTGTIPDFDPIMGSSLSTLHLSFNLFEGTIPASLFNLTSLRGLDLGVMDGIYGTIPSEIGRLSQLNILNMAWMNLHGTIPTEIGQLRDLDNLGLSDNSLSGTLPSEIGLLDELNLLGLEGNMLTGTIPSELGQIFQLRSVYLQHNLFTGTVPLELASVQTLKYLGVSNTSLAHDAFDEFCKSDPPNMELLANCGGEDPIVVCPCCTSCYDIETGTFEVDGMLVCEAEIQQFDAESRGASCSCIDDPNNGIVDLSCADDSCFICNKDSSICADNAYYGSGYNYGGDIPKKWGAGNWLAGQSTFQYIVGRNETVFYQATGQLTCQVTINGEECTSCKREFCHHTGIQGVKVICDNLDGVGNYDPCSGSYKDHNSPLTVFTLQDANLRSASVCSPVFPFFSGLWSPADQTPVLG